MFDFLKPVPTITTEELQDKLKNNIQLIDVRSAEEFHSGHIPEAKNFPLNNLQTFKGNKNEKIYIICQSGNRSKMAAHQLVKDGYQVINIAGGMNQWNGKIIN